MTGTDLYLKVKNVAGRWKYWLWPVNERGRHVTALAANVLFQQAQPGAEAQLLGSTPAGSIVPTPALTEGLQSITNQDNGTTDFLITGGYTQAEFTRTDTTALFSVIKPATLDYYNEGTIQVERIEAMTPAQVMAVLAPLSQQFLEHYASNDEAKALFCAIAATCGLGGGANTFTFRHWQTTPKVVIVAQPSYRGSMEVNDCDYIRGWFADKNNPNTPQVVGITANGTLIRRITVNVSGRDDVKNALAAEGVTGITSTVFGFQMPKPAAYRNNTPTEWGIVGEVGGAPILFNYLQPRTITCAPPAGNDPYPIQQVIQVAANVTKGGTAITATIFEHMSSGPDRVYVGPAIPVWSLKDAPAGFTLTPNNTNFSLSLAATNAATVNFIILTATIGSNQVDPATIRVLSPECTRPASGLTTYGYAYNFIPTGGNARLFDTLDDANNTAGGKYDGSISGDFGTLFGFQVTGLTVGATVYLVNGTQNCAVVSDGIIYVLDSSNGNTVKKAVQVSGGKIVAVKASTYQTPTITCTPHNKLTQTEYDALTSITMRERVSTSVPARAFVSKSELLQYIQNPNENNFDLFRCTSSGVIVGDILYNANNSRGDTYPEVEKYPVEKGFWAYDRTLPTSQATGSVVVIETNACGDIVSRETVTLLLP